MTISGPDVVPALRALYADRADAASMTKLRGDASSRSYYRVAVPPTPRDGGVCLIVMALPEDAMKSDEGTSGARSTELPFLDVQRLLVRRGLPVPAILHVDLPRRVILLEDLGDTTFEARLHAEPGAKEALYEQAVDLLARMHDACASADENSIAYRRTFDEALLRWELDHFREWGLEALSGPLPAAERSALDAAFDHLARELAEAPKGFVHRDYQSRNLMWAPRRDAAAPELVIIDFQDALRGPFVYDLVALLCDSYVSLDEPLQARMIARYARARGLDPHAVDALFWRQAAQRKLKDAGRFVFIDRVRKNPDFLRWFPQSLVYVSRALTRLTDLAEVDELLRRHIRGYPLNVDPPPSSLAPAPTP